MIEVYRLCPMCGRQHYMKLTDEQARKLFEYEQGDSLIQDVFPELGRAEREFLKTGYCSGCQEQIFGQGSEDILER